MYKWFETCFSPYSLEIGQSDREEEWEQSGTSNVVISGKLLLPILSLLSYQTRRQLKISSQIESFL